jgi:hypothetical protein
MLPIHARINNHQQPINVPTAEVQTFLMDHTLEEPTTRARADWWVLTTANATETNGLPCLPGHGKARENKFMVTHPMTDQLCLASAIALTAGPWSSSKQA